MQFIGLLTGRLGQDPEMRTTKNGPMCTFSVAANRRYTNSEGELVENTIWVNCAAFRGQAESAQKYLKKGHLVQAMGSITTRDFVRADGSPGYSVNLDVQNLLFLQSREHNQEDSSEGAGESQGDDGADDGILGTVIEQDSGWDVEDDTPDL